MIDRINLILKAKNITPRLFAEEIGIQPSGMSHILSGRNNPSLDFVMKVVSRYPEIDIKWLVLGQGEMYASVLPVGAIPATSTISPAATLSQTVVANEMPLSVEVPNVAPSSVAAPSSTSMYPSLEGSSIDCVSQQPDLFSFADSSLSAATSQTQPGVSIVSQQQPVVPHANVVGQPQQPETFSKVNAGDGLGQENEQENDLGAVYPAAVSPQPMQQHSTLPTPQISSEPQNAQLNENGLFESTKPVAPEYQNLAKEGCSSQKRIVKVVILYNDHSFSEYYPE